MVMRVICFFLRRWLMSQQQSNLKRIEKQKEKAVAVYTEGKKSAEDLAKKLSKASCTVTVEVNDLDKLYGSVTESEVCAALELEGFNIDKKQVVLENPITELGIFEVNINLHPEVYGQN